VKAGRIGTREHCAFSLLLDATPFTVVPFPAHSQINFAKMRKGKALDVGLNARSRKLEGDRRSGLNTFRQASPPELYKRSNQYLLGIEYAKVAESTGRRWNPVEDGGSGGTLHVTSISFYVISP
jgi:hypothetical protein